MNTLVRPMRITDHPALLALWQSTPGVSVRDADGFDAVASYLDRNPGLSFVAEDDGRIVGGIMAGHDGRRGYLQHLLVAESHRGRGIGRQLVERCTAQLATLGIHKSHIDVLTGNEPALQFWQAMGWQVRSDIQRLSFISGGGSNV
ncbi:GNAT family N-acetyltransferase [Uliginosibacterium sp. H1]|uniref:GNAT family N-acetyltransferase n=1 Tax=Uliginosibacterium sp. H1 TaxID=3114757 RepID=UPI002E183F9D|nr:GNAT family N-acetyltransferase [Uliginosibacterium sp. H1]